MICQYNNISLTYERYAITNGTLFNNMKNISNTSTQLGLTLPVRTSDIIYGNSTNSTYWKLNIPLTVGGTCNGTIEFSAISNE
jgi:hypothetical protein